MRDIVISRRFRGPPDSGNGGYVCGLLANDIPGAARVRLQAPPPLNTPLHVTRDDEGGLMLRDGDTRIATASPADLDIRVPSAPSLAQARQASTGYIGYQDHDYPTCFVCGPERSADDGLCLFPGPVRDWSLLACAWDPAPDLLDSKNHVHPEIVWAALDCPSYFGAAGAEFRRVLLGELTAEILRPVPGGEALVVFSWPMGVQGRKWFGGSAIATSAGVVLARASAIWIELKSA